MSRTISDFVGNSDDLDSGAKLKHVRYHSSLLDASVLSANEGKRCREGGSDMCGRTELQKITKTVVQSSLELMEDKIYKIVLYGSYARGDFDTESDVDIIILLDCDEKELRNYRKRVAVLASWISLENDIEVSLLLKNRDSFEDRRTVLPFYQKIENEGVILYGE